MPDGPRALRSGEFESLMALVNPVFRRDAPGGPTMADEYPHLFVEDNWQNLRIIREDGRIVSHVGTTLRDAVISGCHVRVGNLGGVSTLPEFRGRGFAGACFDDACANAAAQGVDFMLISGDRALYRRAGCRRVGLDQQYTLNRDQAHAVRANLVTEPCREEHLAAVRAIHANEPVRYLRPLEEWQRLIRDGRSAQHHSQLWLLKRGASIVAYAAVYPARADHSADIEELAGDRAALLGGFHELMERSDLARVTLHVQSHDCTLSGLLDGVVEPRPAHAGGTQLILHFTQFMERLRPLMVERVGTRNAQKLSFREYNGRFTFEFDDSTIVTADRGGAAQVIWGTHEPREWEWSVSGAGKDVLEQVFPIPALVYGFSYV